MKKAAVRDKQYSENDKILRSRKMAILQRHMQNGPTGMKEKGKKKETKRLKINKGLDRYHTKEARKAPFFEITFHSDNKLYAR